MPMLISNSQSGSLDFAVTVTKGMWSKPTSLNQESWPWDYLPFVLVSGLDKANLQSLSAVWTVLFLQLLMQLFPAIWEWHACLFVWTACDCCFASLMTFCILCSQHYVLLCSRRTLLVIKKSLN